jgi:hypothetical protein
VVEHGRHAEQRAWQWRRTQQQRATASKHTAEQQALTCHRSMIPAGTCACSAKNCLQCRLPEQTLFEETLHCHAVTTSSMWAPPPKLFVHFAAALLISRAQLLTSPAALHFCTYLWHPGGPGSCWQAAPSAAEQRRCKGKVNDWLFSPSTTLTTNSRKRLIHGLPANRQHANAACFTAMIHPVHSALLATYCGSTAVVAGQGCCMVCQQSYIVLVGRCHRPK